MKRQRGRGRKPGGGGGGSGGGNHHNHGNRSLESNGPDVKIRGTAAQIYEKYAQFARDAQSGGDRVKHENYLQHAEHYYRVMAATMPRERLLQQQNGEGGFQQGQPMNEGAQQQPSEFGMQGGGMHGGSQAGMQGSDSMRSMDDQSADGDEGDDEGDAAEGTSSQSSGSQSSGGQSSGNQSSSGRSAGEGDDVEASGQDGDRQGQGDADGNGRGRRRRGRRRPQEGDRPNAAGGGNTGGDTEARSALDSLARKQGALAGG